MLGLRVMLAIAWASGCGGPGDWTPQWGPGPSDTIAVSVIDSSTFYAAPLSHCEGPPDEVAALGSMCHLDSQYVTLIQDAGDVGFIVYGEGGGQTNAIVVFGYYVSDAAVLDHAADIRYAARYIADVGTATYGRAAIERDVARWESGEELTGSIGTWIQQGDTACQWPVFAGVATFQWKNTTITLRFNAIIAC